jgi:DNA-binding transcriptional ArsR family regulator
MMVVMRQPRHPPLKDLTLPKALKALSDPVRLGIVTTLADGSERGWSEFQVGVGKSTLSQHMKTLREAGITHTRMEGTRCYVSLRQDFNTKFPGLIPAVLALTDDRGA